MADINPGVRTAVYERANVIPGTRIGGCEDCGQRLPLDLHHPERYRVVCGDIEEIAGNEGPNDLMAYCRDCHFSHHRDPNGEYWWDENEMINEWWWHYG